MGFSAASEWVIAISEQTIAVKNGRKLMVAIEKKCAATKQEIDESFVDGDVIKRAKETIADIDVRVNAVRDRVTATAGVPTVDRAKRFGQELIDLAERGPPELEAFVAQQRLPDIPLIMRSYSEAELDSLVQLCFSGLEAST